jgi:hypothetical protein
MARRNTRRTTRRRTPARATTGFWGGSRPRRRKGKGLRWYHLLICFVAAFCLGYLVAFGHATRYVSTVAGLR